MVKNRRAGKLKGEEDTLFSGDFWTGTRALEFGLIDGIGDLRSVMRERYGERVKFRLIEPPRRSLLRRLQGPGVGLADPLAGPEAWGAGMLAAIEERLLWNRFGL
jgi:NhaA family Na+:H+ antiporter